MEEVTSVEQDNARKVVLKKPSLENVNKKLRTRRIQEVLKSNGYLTRAEDSSFFLLGSL